MLRRTIDLFAVLAFLALCGGLLGDRASAASIEAKDANEPIVAECKADLAQRLKVKAGDVLVIDMRATIWPDAALGMAEMGKTYAQVETPGWKIILEAKHSQYLYTASAKAFKYGGPVPIWSSSLLYLTLVPDEPNLNGDLYQSSLLGTNNLRVATGVSAYYPQMDGVVLFTRRTSRSSHDLLVVNAIKPEEPTTLYSAFAFGAAALRTVDHTWAAYVRPRVGGAWGIVVACIGLDEAQPQTLPLPEGFQPGRIAWAGDKLMILSYKGEMMVCFAITPNADKPAWTAVAANTFPGLKSYSLGKSVMLDVTEVTQDGKPRVEVADVWFTGDRNVLATIPGLTLRGHDLLLLRTYDHQVGRYFFIWGEQDGKPAAYTADIATGEVIPSLIGTGYDIKPFAYPPASAPYRIVMAD